MMPSKDGATSLCETVVRELMCRFNWRLLPEEEFVARSLENMRTVQESTLAEVKRACQNLYSQVLYHACQDAFQQEQAYSELHYYLYRIASYRRPDLAEDATQEALLLIFEQIDTCREQGAFLCFAQFKLLQAIKIVDRRSGRRREFPRDDFPWLPSEGLIPPDDKTTEKLWHCLRRVWETHPRARNQLRAVLWKYFDELSDEEIAERLKKTPAQVHVLRSRGMKKLRQCMAERGYAVDRRPSGN